MFMWWILFWVFGPILVLTLLYLCYRRHRQEREHVLPEVFIIRPQAPPLEDEEQIEGQRNTYV